MSQPLVRVLVGFDTIDLSSNPFQLDSATYGVLDTDILAGVGSFDLTPLVLSVNTTRGRSRQLDQFTAGSAVIIFDNTTRILDPLNSDSIYYPYVLPRVPVTITANGTPIFTGVIVDWNLDYDKTGRDIMTAVCSDDFTVLANQAFDAFTPSAELSGDRVITVLNRPEISYTGTRSISAGSSQLGAYAVSEGTNVLNYLQTVTKSEQGFFYVAADGTLVFKGKNDVLPFNLDSLFADDGSGIPYQTLLNQYGDEFLFNYIVTESPAGGPFVASDLYSQIRYQYQQLSLTDLLNSSSGEVEALATTLLDQYKSPTLRFTGVTVQLTGLSLAQQDRCIELDLTELCDVKKSFDVGLPLSVSQYAYVSGISHQVIPGSHIVNYSLEPISKKASGGTISQANGFVIHTFNDSGTFTPLVPALEVEYLVIAGGGGGGNGVTNNSIGGGGGAGGYRCSVVGESSGGGASAEAKVTISTAQTVTVGAGGAANTNGSNSSFGSISATGGGKGGTTSNGSTGGSGGGGSGYSVSLLTGGSGTANEGYAGGDGRQTSPFQGGGGGGAAATGQSGGAGSNGGIGISSSITGTLISRAGGGGGGAFTTGSPGSGSSGGGNGGANGAVGTAATANTGSGGGGGGTSTTSSANGGAGGKGVVIIRYPASR